MSADGDRKKQKVSEGGVLVAQAHQLAGRVFSRILQKHGIQDLNPAQGRIIYALWREDGLSQSELGARTKLEKSTLTQMLARLEEAGQIRREGDPADARRRFVHLTDLNRALHATHLEASKEMVKIYYQGLKPEEITNFENTLRKVIGNLEIV
jgi:MarR family transcriptional regulator, organic hydroperoxide resistance regulator